MTRKCSSSSLSTAVERKVISGYSFMARKSLLLRWLSRSGLRVSMLSAWMVSSTWEFAGLSPSRYKDPSKLVELPAHLAHHGVAGREADPCVGQVQLVFTGQQRSVLRYQWWSCFVLLRCVTPYSVQHRGHVNYSGRDAKNRPTSGEVRWLDENEQRAWRSLQVMQTRLTASWPMTCRPIPTSATRTTSSWWP